MPYKEHQNGWQHFPDEWEDPERRNDQTVVLVLVFDLVLDQENGHDRQIVHHHQDRRRAQILLREMNMKNQPNTSDQPLTKHFTVRGGGKRPKVVPKLRKLAGNSRAQPGRNPLLPTK